ncbi:transketolase C-terminal domain-containing protein [Streptomyces luomodiensis]|uniref:Transketolase C-terminal domain-containing protein n=1 Tax=Streptomyces luomodiensis TaxID=3026192 RepID=A0ABY9URR3_9ACTN|nr:transketolase C-terminal domain-containing protein [Streptomyces sp. SCA4-21]WNE95239.1 transketolase C-terminal domain-containing protein [Streptomyces sp. SCA4-21]
MPSLAFVGVGAIGLPMASRLPAAGYTVTGIDPLPAARERARAAGLTTAARFADVPAADVTLKPFDEETVLGELAGDRLALTLENHTVVGGLYETVASAAVRRGLGVRVTPVALPDAFLAAGALPTLHDRYGLATDRVVETVLAAL